MAETLRLEAARDFERRALRFNDSKRSVWVAFTKDDFAMAKSALVARVVASEALQGGDTGSSTPGPDPLGYVPYDKRLYDALIEVFAVGAAPDSAGRRTGALRLGAAAGGAAAGGAAVRPRVVVHAPLEMLIGCSNESVAEIAGVGPVRAEVVRRLACDAKVDVAVEDRRGTILDQGRVRRNPTPVQRIEIDRRDKGCRFPGCRYTEFTDVHHMQHWADGGLTNLDNLVTLCRRHHRAVHELGWSMSGNADAVLTFIAPHGRTMQSVPSPTWRASPVVRAAEFGRNGPMRR